MVGLLPSKRRLEAMFSSQLALVNCVFFGLRLTGFSSAQTASTTAIAPVTGGLLSAITSSPATASRTPTSFKQPFTVPSAADVGATVIPNIQDPEAVDAQSVCPGYKASNVVRDDLGFSATLSLAGAVCNVYGNDIETLNLTVQYQSSDRLSVRIIPAVVDASNASHYILPDNLVHQPTADADAGSTSLNNDLSLVWNNDRSFSFTVYRLSTGDALFSTAGTKLVYEDQFIEFVSALPENYNLYGLGEVIHGLRLGNNFTRTMYAADIGDTIDA